mmetsp:Transcript_90536/g.166200  ORF Transcript_90536/g.166200 Transcript_90536/m.166200 type:complete len:305 (+) Transcript_90536:412-1326(+)
MRDNQGEENVQEHQQNKEHVYNEPNGKEESRRSRRQKVVSAGQLNIPTKISHEGCDACIDARCNCVELHEIATKQHVPNGGEGEEDGAEDNKEMSDVLCSLCERLGDHLQSGIGLESLEELQNYGDGRQRDTDMQPIEYSRQGQYCFMHLLRFVCGESRHSCVVQLTALEVPMKTIFLHEHACCDPAADVHETRDNGTPIHDVPHLPVVCKGTAVMPTSADHILELDVQRKKYQKYVQSIEYYHPVLRVSDELYCGSRDGWNDHPELRDGHFDVRGKIHPTSLIVAGECKQEETRVVACPSRLL